MGKAGLLGTAAAAALAALLTSAPAAAQDADFEQQADSNAADEGTNDLSVTEIVVTARRRTERLQDTPIAITAFTSADLESRNATGLAEIAPFTPNLVFDRGTGGTGGNTSSQIYIRGIGQADFLFTTEPGVGIYVDGVYYPRSIGSLMDLVDIERIEVLKGPQGTLFGKNSVGGAINIVTQRPGRDFEGKGRLTLGSYDRLDLLASINLPLAGDTLLSRFSLVSTDRDGYVRRVNAKDRLGGMNSLGGQAQLLWQAGEAVEVRLAGDFSRRREDAIANTLIAVDTNASLLALWNALVGPALGTTYDGRFIPSDPFLSFGTGINKSDLDVWGVSGTIEWDLGSARLKSISAYRHQYANFGTDSDHSPIRYYEQEIRDRLEYFSQEIQLVGSGVGGRLNYVLGALFFTEWGHDEYEVAYAPGLFDALEAFPPGIIPGLGGAGNPIHPMLDYEGQITSDIDSKSYAAFAHADFEITSRLSVSGGIRYTYDKKQFRSRFDRFSAGVATHDIDTSEDWQAFTPKVAVEYKPDRDLMLYASAARGYKSGGFNGRPTTAFVARTPFDPEYVWTYEAGFKSSFLDRRAFLNGAAFHSDYTNLQLLAVASDPQGGIVALVENAGAARIRGFELEFRARPSRVFGLDASLGYLDAEYTKLGPNVTAISLESDLVKTPKWSFSLGGEATIPLPGLGELTGRIDYAYRSKVQNVADNVELIAQDGFGLLNARLSFTNASRAWTLSAFGTNLTDKLYITNGLSTIDTLGTIDASYGRPREYGLQLDVRF